MGARPAAIEAVAEVGNPTIIATLTVVVALLPMLFVSGLMGPYMSPIPANASAAMIFSFFVAVMVTPWLMMNLAWQEDAAGGHSHDEGGGFLGTSIAGGAADPQNPEGRSEISPGVGAARCSLTLSSQGGHGEAAAVRQQVRDTGRDRHAARHLA